MKHFQPINKENYVNTMAAHINLEGFATSEIQEIRKILPDIDITGISIFLRTLNIRINKTSDEWFYVRHFIGSTNKKYYKCDQLSGLIECIQFIQLP